MCAPIMSGTELIPPMATKDEIKLLKAHNRSRVKKKDVADTIEGVAESIATYNNKEIN